MSRLSRWFFVSGLFALSACGGGGGGSSSSGGTPMLPAVSLSTTALNFGNQTINTTSAAQSVTLTNSGSASLSISSITLTGMDAALYANTTTCGTTLAVNAHCSISVTFTPTTTASTNAAVSIATDAAGSPATVTLTGTGSTLSSNAFQITIDQGPVGINTANITANIAYTTVTVCTPGNMNQCTTIDHIQVDTGSYGLRLFKSELGAVTPTIVKDPTSANAINECVIYADGYTWGSVGQLDVSLGTRTISGVTVQVLGDTAAGSPPNSCLSGSGKYESTVALFGAKGILGIGVFAEDCGGGCAQLPAIPQWYYTCPSGTCSPLAVALGNQVKNPITLLPPPENNGVVIDLPAVSGVGQATLQGAVYFGVQTQSNNTPAASAIWYLLTGQGTLTTTYKGVSLPNSFIDLGSNGLFFSDSSITNCANSVGFYCPASPLSLSASIAQTAATFTVDNAEADFSANPNFNVFAYLAGNNSSPTAPTSAFDWGSPFFFGRKVYHLFELNSLGTVQGPAIAF